MAASNCVIQQLHSTAVHLKSTLDLKMPAGAPQPLCPPAITKQAARQNVNSNRNQEQNGIKLQEDMRQTPRENKMHRFQSANSKQTHATPFTW